MLIRSLLLTLFITEVFLSVSFASKTKVYEKLETLAKVLSLVETNYIEDVEMEKLVDNAISGVVSKLDPHTAYLPPKMHKEMREDTSGKYGGVGLEVSMRDNQLIVVSPLKDSPASLEDIRPGDAILEIGGKNTKGMNLMEAVNQIRGPEGTKVKLLLKRKGLDETYEVSLKRKRIQVRSVQSKVLEKEYGYVHIKSFQEQTDREMKRHLSDIHSEIAKNNASKKMKGLILDLRNNPGGLLEQAVRVSDIFLGSGVIVSTRGRKGTFQEVKLAREEGTEANFPIITLVNEGTASASEIVAGALQDHHRSIVLGQPTFGKGSVQTIVDLEDGSALKLTIAKYYTPKGISIQAKGITPDIQISQFPPGEKSGAIREKDLKRHIGEERSSEKNVNKTTQARKESSEDIQLNRALEYLKTWKVFKGKLG